MNVEHRMRCVFAFQVSSVICLSVLSAMESPNLCVVLRHHLPCCRNICSYLPLIKVRHPCFTFLRLRVICRSVLSAVTMQMARRIILYREPAEVGMGTAAGSAVTSTELARLTRSPTFYQQAKRMKDSGFLFQCWLPASRRPEQRLLHRKRLLLEVATGRPRGMTAEYLHSRQCSNPGLDLWKDGHWLL